MSIDMVFEDVPRISRRVGDCVFAGANNSTILLGRDRVTGVDTGYGSRSGTGSGRDAGAIHLIVGRSGEDPSPAEDAATVFLSTKNDPDAMANTGGFGENRTGKSAAFIRGDCVRIVPRVDLKVSVGSAYLLIDSEGNVVIEGNISLGADAAESIIRGDQWKKFWSTVTVPTPMGPSGPPPPIPDFVFTSTSKVK